MKIIILSDLNWESHLRSVTEIEVNGFDKSNLAITRYDSLRRYYSIIQEEKAEMILFAGDVTGDGSCGHGFHYVFMLLLKLLEMDKTPSAYISGNHDEDRYYALVNAYAESLQYTQEISNQSVDIKGLKILGINYYQSKSKTQLKNIFDEHTDHYDIVLAHSQLKRRIRLFELGTDYIFTGHYDRKLFYHDDTAYVSLDNDANEISYAIIDKSDSGTDTLSIMIRESVDVTIGLEEDIQLLSTGIRSTKFLINGVPTLAIDPIEKAHLKALTNGAHDYSYLKFIRGTQYQRSLQTMQKLKAKKELEETDLSLVEVLRLQIINNYRISESMIEDYLGNVL